MHLPEPLVLYSMMATVIINKCKGAPRPTQWESLEFEDQGTCFVLFFLNSLESKADPVLIAPLIVLEAAALEAAYRGNMIGVLVATSAIGIRKISKPTTATTTHQVETTNRYLLRSGWERPPMQSRP
jgi:hypothetical protein